MKTVRVRRIGLIVMAVLTVLAIAALTSGGLAPQNQLSTQTNQKLSLARPPFLQAARAQAPEEVAAMLDQEAGISAWMYSPVPIDLVNAANAFRVIEDQTADYIIGSVDLVNYTEHYDAHAYVHEDGWILAYYLRPDPTAKMISIKEGSILTTNLAAIIGTVASFGGVPLSDINYYDFRFPNAESILLVYENNADGDDYTINMPTSFAYYERSFASYWSITLNGTEIRVNLHDGNWGYNTISAAQLPPGVTHSIKVYDYNHVLAITYSEP